MDPLRVLASRCCKYKVPQQFYVELSTWGFFFGKPETFSWSWGAASSLVRNICLVWVSYVLHYTRLWPPLHVQHMSLCCAWASWTWSWALSTTCSACRAVFSGLFAIAASSSHSTPTPPTRSLTFSLPTLPPPTRCGLVSMVMVAVLARKRALNPHTAVDESHWFGSLKWALRYSCRAFGVKKQLSYSEQGFDVNLCVRASCLCQCSCEISSGGKKHILHLNAWDAWDWSFQCSLVHIFNSICHVNI